ncbi:GIY-YIG catalytic domain protein [compost metagenome]
MKKIYAIKNKTNGKMYVGSSRQYGDNRWKTHLKILRANCHHSSKLQRAWNKYGEENFEYIILEKLNDEQDQFEKEQYWIDLKDSYRNGYNATETAGRVDMTDEVKEKIRNTMKGRPLSSEHIKAFSQAKIGEKRSSETKEKMRIAAQGRKHSKDTKEKIGDSCRGKKRSEESKKRYTQMVESRTEEHKLNIALSKLAKKDLTVNQLRDLYNIANKVNKEEYKNLEIEFKVNAQFILNLKLKKSFSIITNEFDKENLNGNI